MPLHLHFVTDADARLVLSTVLKTWKLPSVDYSFYDLEDFKDMISWIPNNHYSGIYGLIKLLLPDVLPNWLDKVIVLDSDLTISSDISYLWRILENLNSSTCIGLVENQSDWYLGKLWKGHRPWPALGRGFNTGVILWNLKQTRSINWTQLWQEEVKKQIPKFEATSLADQDVLNAVICRYPTIVSTLPCELNVQLNENTRTDLCTADHKILHWNTPEKFEVVNNRSVLYRELYLHSQQYDGYLLRSAEHLACTRPVTRLPPPQLPDCPSFRREQRLNRRIHPFFTGRLMSTESVDVTLALQMSLDRLNVLESIGRQWKGPVSIALYMYDAEITKLVNFIRDSHVLQEATNIAIHVVFRYGEHYPVNLLRNVATQFSRTSHVFICDADFVPMPRLHEYLLQTVQQLETGNKKLAFVVPAFESKVMGEVPINKKDLITEITVGNIMTFRYKIWPKGHFQTNYERWKISTEPYKITWSMDYEPYVVLRKDAPKFDERFVGFGWNKVAHCMQLDADGYQFMVLPEAYIVHYPHAPSFDINAFRSSHDYRRCVHVLKEEFQRDLVRVYGVKALKYLEPGID